MSLSHRDHAPVVICCQLEWAGPQVSKATPGSRLVCVSCLVFLECLPAFRIALHAFLAFLKACLLLAAVVRLTFSGCLSVGTGGVSSRNSYT